MKQLAAIIFMGCFISLTFSRPLLLFNFYINQDAIIAKFCVNKQRPQLHCDGKCFLAKKIKEQDKRDAGNALLENTRVEAAPASGEICQMPAPPAFEAASIYAAFASPYIPYPVTAPLFKPPSAAFLF